jgi:hypothetical protein
LRTSTSTFSRRVQAKTQHEYRNTHALVWLGVTYPMHDGGLPCANSLNTTTGRTSRSGSWSGKRSTSKSAAIPSKASAFISGCGSTRLLGQQAQHECALSVGTSVTSLHYLGGQTSGELWYQCGNGRKRTLFSSMTVKFPANEAECCTNASPIMWAFSAPFKMSPSRYWTTPASGAGW